MEPGFSASTSTANSPYTFSGEPLPGRLQQAMECLAGYALSDVRVYRESPWPSRIGARAFVLGSDIHLAPGAEDALEHELWHVVQQKQGRVRANRILDLGELRLGGAGLNDDEALEREADAKARLVRSLVRSGEPIPERESLWEVTIRRPVVQRAIIITRGAITGQQVTVNAAGARTRLSAMYQMTANNTHALGQVTDELSNANMTFPDWLALKSEVKRRSFGRSHAALMDELRQLQDGRRTTFINNYNGAHPLAQINNAGLCTILEKMQKAGSNLNRLIQTYGRPNFITWVDKTGPLKAQSYGAAQSKPIYRWYTSQTNSPLTMNCWECVLFSGAWTGGALGALYGRDYALWALQEVNVRFYNWGTWETEAVPTFVAHVINHPVAQTTAPQKGQVPPITPLFAGGILPGMIVVFNDGQHVALATGGVRAIELPAAQNAYGRLNGSEILELDGATFWMKITTMEDIVTRGYNNNIKLGWLPDSDPNVAQITLQTPSGVLLHQTALNATHFYS